MQNITSIDNWKNPDLYEKLRQEDKTEYKNNCSVISYWFQIIENHALYLAYNFLIKNEIVNKNYCCLEYDGLCIPPINKQYDELKLINDLNTHIFKKMGLPIKYKFKQYNTRWYNQTIGRRWWSRRWRRTCKFGRYFEQIQFSR